MPEAGSQTGSLDSLSALIGYNGGDSKHLTSEEKASDAGKQIQPIRSRRLSPIFLFLFL